MKLDFSQQIFEKYTHKNFVIIRPVAAELVHTDARKDRQTDVRIEREKLDEVNNRFLQFCVYA